MLTLETVGVNHAAYDYSVIIHQHQLPTQLLSDITFPRVRVYVL